MNARQSVMVILDLPGDTSSWELIDGLTSFAECYGGSLGPVHVIEGDSAEFALGRMFGAVRGYVYRACGRNAYQHAMHKAREHAEVRS